MFAKRNMLENLTTIFTCSTLFSIALNYVTDISPLSGIWFTLYILVLYSVSLILSYKLIYWLLHLNKPVKYDLQLLAKKYPYLSVVLNIFPSLPERNKTEWKEYDTNELSVISTVLERKLVSSWYMPYVSPEIGFPFACKQMLDQMISRTFQICNKIEPKNVFIDTCCIVTSHLKEYKKALKRQENSPNSSIGSLYKKSHTIFNRTGKKYESADHCTSILRIILKELVPWELWDTPHSELLVRILSKRLNNFIDNTLADPVWLNDKLMTMLNENDDSMTKKQEEITTENVMTEFIPEENKEFEQEEPKLIEETALPKPETTIESALSTLITKSTAPILHRAIEADMEFVSEETEAVEEVNVAGGSEPMEITSSPVMRQKRGRQGRNEVKIYDRIIEGSVKTWETDVDLQCISLGQDLLASLNGEITLSRLWGQDGDNDGGKGDQGLWFGEEDALDLELDSPKNRSPVKKEAKDHSPKPADALLKDLQTTVHQAKTKIGDLQVSNIDVARTNDEAAGMMEGLLDFGIAGLKKGLRFTGLSDDAQDKSPSHHPHHHPPREKMENTSPPPESKAKPGELREPIISSIIQREDNGLGSVPHLVKQQRVASQDSVPIPRPMISEAPPLAALPDSPEPVYEEAADLSTSIAKLRSLLSQRAAAERDKGQHDTNEEIWWEGAEETRGRAARGHSARHVDSAAAADEYDMNADRNSSPGQMTNNMQRLDKLLSRTVTGVLNSIKTAVGADGEPAPAAPGPPAPPARWTYVTTSIELSVCYAVARLVGSRRAFHHVDAALDSLDQLAAPPKPPAAPPEDFEEWSAALSPCAAALSAAAAAAGAPGSHVAARLVAIAGADIMESLISLYLDEVSSWLRSQVFVAFEALADQPPEPQPQRRSLRELNVEVTTAALLKRIPNQAFTILGSDTVRSSTRLAVASFASRDVNKDVVFRVLDLFAVQFKTAAGLRNPSFDNN